MSRRRLSLGLDLSTQSLSASVLDIDRREAVISHSLNYLKDPRLNGFGIGPDYILPPREEGEADQPPALFLAALDATFDDLRHDIDMADISVINVSGQQHGHVYLNDRAGSLFVALNSETAAGSSLTTLLRDGFAYDRAPIWMTSSTGEEAAFIRERVGGKDKLIALTGSDAQLRFTGIVIRHVANRFPDVYRSTAVIQLLGNFVSAVLTGNARVPADFGNGCGMSLMNYVKKDWDQDCLRAIADGLPGGAEGLRQRLPDIAAPDAVVGTVCRYSTDKYGLSQECLVAAGSGDNPQSKVLISGDLLSLGTSFVNMVATDGKTMDMTGAASAMYDGAGRPFMFGCRTNGALVWDQVRGSHGLSCEDYAPAEQALAEAPLGKHLVLWQPRTESFPVSGSFGLWREEDVPEGLGPDYAGCIESSLAAVYVHSRPFAPASESPLYVTGGATSSPGIMRRIADIWRRPVISMQTKGAALGAAAAGVSALCKHERRPFDIDDFTSGLVSAGREVRPLPEDIAAFHNPGGYLERFVAAESKLFRTHPL